MDYRFLAQFSQHFALVRGVVFAAVMAPLLLLLYEYNTDSLGIDPLARLTHMTGKTALVLLLLSLLITPLRHFLVRLMVGLQANFGKRLSDWNWIIRLRRMIGVMSFVYALLHFVIYFWLDQGADIHFVLQDISERKFILVGMVALLLLLPLVVTSTNGMMRRLKRNWRRLHRLVYLIQLLVLLHYWMLSKNGVYEYVPYTVAGLLLLGWRLWYYLSADRRPYVDDGMEVKERNRKFRQQTVSG